MKTLQKCLGVLAGLILLTLISMTSMGRGSASFTPRVNVGAVPAGAATEPETTLFIRFGISDRQATEWNGSIAVSPGTVSRLEPWRFAQQDAISEASWTASTRRLPAQTAAEKDRGADAMPLADNGVFATLTGCTPDSKIQITTTQGAFEFALADASLGRRLRQLDGRVEVQAVPSSSKIISTTAEEDFPAVAVGPDGTTFVAYLAFTPRAGFATRAPLTEVPQDFSFLAEPSGGDQLWLARLVPGKDRAPGKWEDPVAVTPPGQDLFRSAVAVDGSGEVWIFWSQNVASDGKGNGNWELMARGFKNDQWSEPIRVSSEEGSDIAPAAATDGAGRVWVVWQSFVGNVSHILAARHEPAGDFRRMVISDAPGNKWDPAIAAGPGGHVAFAWDTYERGNYDVQLRMHDGKQLGEVIPIAGSERYEVRPSLAYDRKGRLWIAWEEAPEKWSKDFGALEVDGWPIYRRHTVNVRVLVDGTLYRTSGDIAAAFPASFEGRAGQVAATAANQAKKAAAKKDAAQRSAGAHEDRQDNRPPTSMPRLAVDAADRVWIAFRARTMNTRANIGSIWHEFVSFYDGKEWKPGTLVPLSDGLLDNRPAWSVSGNGTIALIGSSDGRHASVQAAAAAAAATPANQKNAAGQVKAKAKKAQAAAQRDAINYDLVAAWMPVPSAAPTEPALEAAAAAPVDIPEYVTKEREDVKRIREFRSTIDGRKMRIVRGEFHRHTEISPDGGGDGTLEEMWRYGLDAVSMDWIGNGDHDNGMGREYTWWLIQKTTDIYTVDGHFTPLYTYERSVVYPDGHRNVVFPRRGIRTLPRLQSGLGKAQDDDPAEKRPPTPDTQMLYGYLKHFGGVCASHTSGTNMGTDWRDNDPTVEPFVEIYQGDRQNYEMPGAPRSNTEDWSIGGWRPLGFVSLALKRGYRLAFESSSDHVSTHISFCNVFVEEPTREAIVRAMRQRRVYAATDNIIADFRCGDHFMGEEFEQDGPPRFSIHLIGTAPFARVQIVRNNEYVYSFQPARADVQLDWTDSQPPTGTNYYYVRGEQEDGELVWVTPIWIRRP
jgi:hypothetical protein